jgi:2-iminobutanoate/2-iminopropanoate deaminase
MASGARNIVRRIIQVADAPKPVGPYSQAVLVDNTMYVSGCLGMEPATGNLVTGGIEPEANQALKNMGAILRGAGIDYRNVVKVTVLLSDINDWPTVNSVYQQYFTSHFPARAAYAVKDLPKGAKVEIEAVAVVGHIEDKE